MTDITPEMIRFLLEAKRSTYAGNGPHAPSSRPASVDLSYQDGDYFYLDSYLGGLRFAGEEAVWHKGQPLWSMNYFGWMLVEEVPPAFGEFLKMALLEAPGEAPYRGPACFVRGDFEYQCQWQGSPERFEGRETICQGGAPIYELVFHGGSIQ
jgi:hypothetical protein